MKKKFVSVALMVAMLAVPASALAEKADIIPISAGVGDTVVPQESEAKFGKTSELTVQNVVKGDDYITIETINEAVESENQMEKQVNLMMFDKKEGVFDNTGKTVNVNSIKKGDKVVAYLNYRTPMTMQLPVTYRPTAVIVQTEEIGFVDVDVYNKELVNSANTLKLNLSKDTKIVDEDGKKEDEIEAGDILAVFYTVSTRSIPAQTTPEKVVVLGDYDLDYDKDDDDDKDDDNKNPDIDINKPATPGDPNDDAIMVDPDGQQQTAGEINTIVANGTEIKFDAVTVNGTHMVPVRAVAEALDLEVGWDSKDNSVTIGTVQMGVHFKLGSDAYQKAKMAPISLGQAPVSVTFGDNGVTYVPASFFTDVVEGEAVQNGATLTITLQ